jgi:hypothetical protein
MQTHDFAFLPVEAAVELVQELSLHAILSGDHYSVDFFPSIGFP